MKLNSKSVASSLRNVFGAMFLMLSMSQGAMAGANEYCDPVYSGGDSAYVPCVSSVDLGNGRLVVYDNDGNVVHEEWSGRGGAVTSNQCYAYNRDGRTCSFVGFSEGQVGYPWGGQAGKFECTNGCLKIVGP
jgi:hypothetical protein